MKWTKLNWLTLADGEKRIDDKCRRRKFRKAAIEMGLRYASKHPSTAHRNDALSVDGLRRGDALIPARNGRHHDNDPVGNDSVRECLGHA